MGKTRDFFKKIRDTKGTFHAKMGLIKDRNGMDLFITGNWNVKVGSQEIPGVTGKFGLGVHNETGQRLRVLITEHTGHSKHPLITTQEKTLHMDITIWSTPKSD